MDGLEVIGTTPHDAARARRAATAARLGLPYNRARHLDRILQQRAVQTVYQPIVDLASGEVLAYEALSRGPARSALERPDLLFQAARDCGLTRELDWICRAKAMGTALDAGFGGALTLFVNVEPDVAATIAPDDLVLLIKTAERELRIVLEVTERSLLDRPAELLHWLSWARERWWGVALDDVGATSESLALMPFVNPDVIKLDFRFIRQAELDGEDMRVIRSVQEHAARTGASILAEGIETAADVVRAHELGATLAQGWFFGRPAALPQRLPSPRRAVPLLASRAEDPSTSPWDVVEATGASPATVTEAHARRIFAGVEQGALLSHEAPLVLGSFPAPPGPWGDPDERLGRLRGRAVFCGAVGPEVTTTVAPGWQTAAVHPLEEMADEWCLAVVAPHHAEVVVAYDAGDRDESGHRLLEIVVSQDREAVSRVAEMLMRKLARPTVGIDGRRLADSTR
jgi:EAL domain-containing protein (putative c-di-GMP-specific phosphodiesterase class I)